jgi:uncharacterized protein
VKIWVDADACPVVVKEILYRAAMRTHIHTLFVANQLLQVPPSPFIKALQVDKGFDVADARIVEELLAGDLVITADIPLAALVIAKQAHALNPRGEFYSLENIQERLTMRNMMEQLRASGIETSGPNSFNHSDRQAFSSQLDRFLTHHTKA